MGNFRYKFAQFMIGRNGFDALCRGLLMLSLILIFADIIIPGNILRTIGLVLPEISTADILKIPGTSPALNHPFAHI